MYGVLPLGLDLHRGKSNGARKRRRISFLGVLSPMNAWRPSPIGPTCTDRRALLGLSWSTSSSTHAPALVCTVSRIPMLPIVHYVRLCHGKPPEQVSFNLAARPEAGIIGVNLGSEMASWYYHYIVPSKHPRIHTSIDKYLGAGLHRRPQLTLGGVRF